MTLTKIDDRGLKTPIDLLDNEKIRFGDATTPDLEIYHDGSDAYVTKTTATGRLKIKGDGIQLQTGSDNFIHCDETGIVQINFDGNTRIATSNGGISVTGDVTATGVIIGTNFQPTGYLKLEDDQILYVGTGNDLQIKHSSSDNNSYITESGSGSLVIKADDLYIQNAAGGHTNILADSDGKVELAFNGSPKLETTSTGVSVTGDVTASGKINIGSSTHTTRKLAIHDTTNAAIVIEGASNGSSSVLFADENDEDVGFISYNHVTDDLLLTAADNIILTSGAGSKLQIRDGNTTGNIKFNAVNSAENANVSLEIAATDTLFFNGGTEKLRITSTGKVGINQTSPSSALDVNGEISLPFNNTLRWLESDGTVASDIYTNSGNTLIFRNNSGAQTANLDTSGNLELAGNLQLASTKGINFSNYGSEDDSALTGIYDNLLDDYESGLWYPTLSSGTATWYNARYVKIGKFVQIWGRFYAPTDASTDSAVLVTSLPFAVESNNAGGSCFAQYVSDTAPTTSYLNTNEELAFYGISSGGWNYLKYSDLDSTNSQLYFQASYRAVA